MGTILSPLAAAAARRRALAKKLQNGIALVTAAPPAVYSRDTHHPYRQNSYLFYLTHCAEPDTALLLEIQDGELTDEVFFCPAPDDWTRQWEGERISPRAVRRRLHIDAAADIAHLPDELSRRAARHDTLHYAPAQDAKIDQLVLELIGQRRAGNRDNKKFPALFSDITCPLDDMRLVKDEAEITALRAACDLTVAGITAALRAARHSQTEAQLEAAIIAAYRAGGGRHAFLPIVAGGKNACTLHYTQNSARLRRNKAVLIDTGAELHGYAGDISRTFPADGEWNGAFVDVYTIVLAAQKSALAAAKPGVTLEKLQSIATRKLAQGLRDLKLCRGTADDIIKRQRHKRFYMHGIGHWLGLDVHDVGATTQPDGAPRVFVPGMVLTVEPGLYIPAATDIPPALRGIGVRIEDDIVITPNGCDILTAAAPKTPAALRACMNG